MEGGAEGGESRGRGLRVAFAPCACACAPQALETEFSARLTHGPPLENGFFYDSYLGGSSYAESMKATVEKKVGQTNWPQPSPQLRRKPPLQP